MQIPCNVVLTVAPGTAPGTLNGTLQIQGTDGTVFQSDESNPLRTGESVTIGPLLIEVTTSAQFTHETAAPTPGQPANPGKPGQPPKR